MPKYIDYHAKMPSLKPEQLNDLKQHIGKTDANGVKTLGVYLTRDGQGYCVTEAPNADAVCKAHQTGGMDLPKGDVHELANSIT